MNTRPDVDQLLRQMQQTRQRLDKDVEAAKRAVHDMTDWRQLVARAPLKSLAGAAALGYFLVPRRIEKRTIDAAEVERVRGREPVVIAQQEDDDAKNTLVSTVIAIAGAGLARAASAYVANRISRYVHN